MAGWIGVDLDGTLAKYPPPLGSTIGEPVPLMLERVKKWLSDGQDVKIMTARACTGSEVLIGDVKEWCKKHIGQELDVTATKDFAMIELWDDRAVQVLPNTGVTVGSN